MENKDLRILVKEILKRKGFSNGSINSTEDVWSAADASAWKKFTMNCDGFSFYANKIPSLISLPTNIVERLVDMHKEINSKNKSAPTSAPEPQKPVESVKQPTPEVKKEESKVETIVAPEPQKPVEVQVEAPTAKPTPEVKKEESKVVDEFSDFDL